jgi:hypothetical protein
MLGKTFGRLLATLFPIAMVFLGPGHLAGQTFEDCGWCRLGSPCVAGEHAVWGGMSILAGFHGDCWAPGNCANHGACEGQDEDLEPDLVQAVRARDAESLKSLLEAPNPYVHVNTERNVLQMMSCDGEFVVRQYRVGPLRLSDLVDPTA